MNIAVCVKQVPDASDVKIDKATGTMVRDGVPSILNPFDAYAVEEAIALKEKHGGNVTALTMGPPQAAEVLRHVVAMGVDDVMLLSDRAFAGADTWATSYTLGLGLKRLDNLDLVICGKQAIDGDTAQVGPGVAVNLGLPFVAYVRKVIEVGGGKMKVERLIEDGYEVVEVELPAVITVVKEINSPRMPSLKGKMKAKKLEVAPLSAADLGAILENIGLPGSPTKVVKVFSPPPKGKRETLVGTPDEQVSALVDRLAGIKVI
ncbi:MAG: electron transfer flavoprotein subunit beta/FixA family protein [Nitrospirae bacterium]|nr:electron transfer flavoprotein subunit beta/FixA family protein [Nitrospirota bacterium]MBI5694839.1 electron transfer flavoprotein subunit beta/FixA family protein [Nitrospirota bacterium]